MKLTDYIKFGFGFYIGQELSKKFIEVIKVVYPEIKEKFKKGY